MTWSYELASHLHGIARFEDPKQPGWPWAEDGLIGQQPVGGFIITAFDLQQRVTGTRPRLNRNSLARH